MAEQAFAADASNKPTRAIAWAVASKIDARRGARGYSASACAISYDGGQTWIKDIKTSRYPNRTTWLAGIMAVRRVLETITPGADVTIYVPNEQIALCYDAGWVKRDGKPAKDADAAKPIFDMRDQFQLRLEIIHAPLDAVSEPLQVEARAAARRLDAVLTPEQRIAVPAESGAQPHNQFGGFPPVRDDECESD